MHSPRPAGGAAVAAGSPPYHPWMADGNAKPVVDAVARATEATKQRRAGRTGRASDVFGGELRRRDVFPLLVLHLVGREPA